MPNILADRVLESSVSAGTGVFTLAGAVLGFRAFSAVCAVTDTMPYYIEAVDAQGRPTGEWEFGLGTYSAANQLTRTTVRGSSNAGLAVAFAAGTKLVGLGIAAPNSTATRQEWRTALDVYSIAQVDAAIAALGLSDGKVAQPGDIKFVTKNTAPAGWLKANGATLTRATYPALWTAVDPSTGGAGGAGNGTTTFTVPDLRGEFIRGWDDSRGVDSGRVFGSAQSSQNLAHTHQPGDSSAFYTSGGGSGNFGGGGIPVGTPTTTTSSGGAEARPRNVALLACIKF